MQNTSLADIHVKRGRGFCFMHAHGLCLFYFWKQLNSELNLTSVCAFVAKFMTIEVKVVHRRSFAGAEVIHIAVLQEVPPQIGDTSCSLRHHHFQEDMRAEAEKKYRHDLEIIQQKLRPWPIE